MFLWRSLAIFGRVFPIVVLVHSYLCSFYRCGDRYISPLHLTRSHRRVALLRSGQFVMDLMSHVQQACRRRILELKSKRAVGLQTAITPLVPWSTRSASDSFYVQHMLLVLLRRVSFQNGRMIIRVGRDYMMLLRRKVLVCRLLSGNGDTIKLVLWATVDLPRRRRCTLICTLLPHLR